MVKVNPIEQLLDQFDTLILDGALATELEKLDCDLEDPLWSARVLLDEPEKIRKVHYAYFEAGADIAITASYQASIDGFKKRGISEADARALMKKTVELAQQAREDYWMEKKEAFRPYPLIAGSVGPYGAYLADGSEYIGNYGVSDSFLYEFHKPRIEALVEAGADLLAVETIPSLQEARVICDVLKEFPDISAWMTFSLRDAVHISEGTSLKECAEVLNACSQIAAVGVNCVTTEFVSDAVQALHASTQKPIIIYPNSGEHYNPETKTWNGDNDVHMDAAAADWAKKGAKIIGGCCRTGPEDIRGIHKILRGNQ
ncbi:MULTISPECIES: homocysteine S-methyltransferase [Oceanobacillus]|uniref:S-methylmethionine:homocysteine methyltransferase n=2 Tax=Oceanobacillus TaxID=182709 RepID=A0A0A1MFZ7_9BACI|nr:homocysteine S-methyltransferase [Oceanobacillus oncorhynchi]MDM8100044.1 homocysteine S-methyltransferase [Oceanobacillus oncorhynchi]CEI82033.1 Homocysteine S-methyltransferase [Oceanobacillus oncorhynchi]